VKAIVLLSGKSRAMAHHDISRAAIVCRLLRSPA